MVERGMAGLVGMWSRAMPCYASQNITVHKWKEEVPSLR
jgi:hypothetical protein